MSDLRIITRDELKLKMERGDKFYLVDTLAPDRFRHSHLRGALNLPWNRVAELAATLLPDKRAEIVTYCASYT